MSEFLTPKEIATYTEQAGIKKTSMPTSTSFILGILAGAFIAFASEGSNMAAFNLFAKPETYGLGKCIAGAIFGTGLMLVVIAGGELFTGNTLIIISVLKGKVKWSKMLKNWSIVYLGNFIGSVFIAFMMVQSGLFNSGANGLGGATIKIAAYKVGLSFMPALYLGIMCNWLVCLAVWMSYGSKTMIGKIFAVFFPIWLFITSGFEHSVANMYYITAGIMAKTNAAWVAASHVTPDKLAGLNWGTFVTKNLIPVTIGNIIGGAVFVGTVYWFAYLKDSAETSVNSNIVSKDI
ncbi:formate/nitrite transporter family protein [Clostridium bowmanii]|uniref:formate/nitrite transporter family protein n=1 Tax=Clostridium bowmanii TaxID=132925 RepID=UPI001C0C65E4|nr:formate/nitrite transporter family protein [Clostridium bowmanii]MBU3188790.1 formate/nitrite transporter family protein [Clostridium bowmanii]MCA1073373.1 formate/nitrite transporter family protein [Clostridium bowmanii]